MWYSEKITKADSIQVETPNSKANRFKSKLVAKKNLAKVRQKVYNKAKAEGMTDMQALVKSFEISPRED